MNSFHYIHGHKFINQVSTLYEYMCEDSTICKPIEITLDKGVYALEVWGASGGSNETQYQAQGGYSFGIIRIDQPVNAFVYIGGQGIIQTNTTGYAYGGYNGGGRSAKHRFHNYVGSGGGATDIRLINESLNNRVIVAGGGGGTGNYKVISKGGCGGGLTGLNGANGTEYGYQYGIGGLGGVQYDTNLTLFGKGQDHEMSDHVNACGGGGGWFGGQIGEKFAAGGGGGSGFVYDSPNDLVNLTENFFLFNAFTLAGNETIPIPKGDDSSILIGNGFARITSLLPSITIRPSKCERSYFSLVAIFISYSS